MAAMEIVKNAVETAGVRAYANVYSGGDAEYCTINCTELPDDYGDDTPGAIRYLTQVHWFAPNGVNPRARKRAIIRALVGVGCTYPQVTDASDLDGLHFVFECEYADGDTVEADNGEIQC